MDITSYDILHSRPIVGLNIFDQITTIAKTSLGSI